MNFILDKYNKYNIHFNQFSKNLIIKSKIPVKDFIKLRKEIETLNIYIKDIIVIG